MDIEEDIPGDSGRENKIIRMSPLVGDVRGDTTHIKISPKPVEKRIITQTWNIPEDVLKYETQMKLLDSIHSGEGDDGDTNNSHYIKKILQQIRGKIHSYKYQDVEKKLLDPTRFVQIKNVLDLLKISQLKCYYCKENVLILYEYVREPKQWTLERINNDYGHNVGNVEIACLTCNLRRRCMNKDKFLFTKQMKITKIG
jgi:hypothetical protein